jgi:hypothetical protein
MGCVVKIDVDRAVLPVDAYEEIVDLALDYYNEGVLRSPAMTYISERLGIDEIWVTECFRYYQVFGKWNGTFEAEYIQNTGQEFWWNCYLAYVNMPWKTSLELVFKLAASQIKT